MIVPRFAILFALTALALALTPHASPGTQAPPSRLQVVEREFTLVMSRQAIRRGPVVVELLNFGRDYHDLVLRRRARGAKPLRIAPVAPRGRGELRARLAAGRYDVLCSIPGHAEAGMRATLRVRG
jgi:hypothetical protein